MLAQAAVLSAFALSQSPVMRGVDAPQTQVPAYEIIDLGDFGGELAIARGISDTGVVVGAAETPYTMHPFLWRDGTLVDLGYLTPETTGGEADAISADGAFVGGGSYAPFPPGGWSTHPIVWTESAGMQDLLPTGSAGTGDVIAINSSGLAAVDLGSGGGFLWSKAMGFKSLSAPGAMQGFASTVNALSEAGVACGYQVMSPAYTGAWKYDSVHDEYSLLPGLGNVTTIANGINGHGDVVGLSVRPNLQMRPLLWTNGGEVVDLGFVPVRYFTQGVAYAINDSRWIVGVDSYDLGGRLPIGWLWIDGRKHVLTERIADPAQRTEWPYLFPLAINNAGQIVGQGGKDPAGQDGRAFLMNPLPPGASIAPPAHSTHASPGSSRPAMDTASADRRRP